MKSVDIHQAKAQLSQLIERVEAGEEFIIAKAGRPAARLVPIESSRKPIKIGGLKTGLVVPDHFNTLFESEIETLFSGAPLRQKRRRAKRQ